MRTGTGPASRARSCAALPARKPPVKRSAPTIETITIRRTPASRPSSCRLWAEAWKNVVAASWSGDGWVAATITVSTPAGASASPSPGTTSTPLEREIDTTSWRRAASTSTTWRPTLPVAPVTAILLADGMTVSFQASSFAGNDERAASEGTGDARLDTTGPACAILNLMVQYSTTVDRAFAALADPTRRAVVERLGTGSATISELAEPFGMSLTGMRKHVRLLEE